MKILSGVKCTQYMTVVHAMIVMVAGGACPVCDLFVVGVLRGARLGVTKQLELALRDTRGARTVRGSPLHLTGHTV